MKDDADLMTFYLGVFLIY